MEKSIWCHTNSFDASSGLGYRDPLGYRERGGIKAKRAGSGREGLAFIPTEGYFELTWRLSKALII